MGDVFVSPGDLIVGDIDGVVSIPNERISEVVLAAEKREAAEREILTRLRAGESTLQVFGLDRALTSQMAGIRVSAGFRLFSGAIA